MVKILIIGDPHGKIPRTKKFKKNAEKADFILITGDIGKCDLARKQAFKEANNENETSLNKKQEKAIYNEIYSSSMEVLNFLKKFAPVYLILGNVGTTTESEIKEKEKELNIKLPHLLRDIKKLKGVYLVKNSVRKIKNIKIGFLEYFIDSGWLKDFKPQAEQESIQEAKKETKKAEKVLNYFKKQKIDILLCHQPPYKILDKVSSKYNPPKNWIGKNAGSRIIKKYIKKPNKELKYVFCGHIHEACGNKKIGKVSIYNLGHNGNSILIDI